MIHRGTYDGTIYYNPANKFCIISVKTAEKDVPEEARSTRRRKDHLIRFVATGYELPRTDAVELELDGEWKKGKYGMQLQVEQWHEIVPQTKSGVEGYLASGLIKGIGPALAKQIVSRFGVETLDILQNRPERLLEIKGITENKLEAIKTSYAESRMLQDLMTLLSPFKITPKTAQKIYQFFGPASVDILKKSPFELCQISGFGFLRVDAIVQKNGGDLRAPMRIKGALFWALEDSIYNDRKMKNLEEKQVKICSCAVIGQHPTRFKFKYNEYMTSCKRIKKRMHDVFVSLYQRGVRCFFVGGALGVDMWAGEILLDMQRQVEYRELDVVMVCPFPGHDVRWDPKSQARQRKLREGCVKVLMGSEHPGGEGYKRRTEYMMKRADYVVAVYDNDPSRYSGVRTAMCIVEKRNLPMVLIHPDTGIIKIMNHSGVENRNQI